MKKKSYHVIGVMSGTSLDGIDLASCVFEIDDRQNWTFKILEAETIPYNTFWQKRLRNAIRLTDTELMVFDAEYTQYLSEVIGTFLKKLQPVKPDVICSHGHTIRHEPDKGVTWQIGNLPELAEKLGQYVVCDFRSQDVALGGQGAPLVPIGDRILFSDYDYCLNLGGFANISYEDHYKRIAYDICPVNIVLNAYSQKLGKPFDHKGHLAASGLLQTDVLSRLNALDYYGQPPPKSLGLEWVKQHVFPILKNCTDIRDVLRTYTEHIAMQLASRFECNKKVLVTGGGVYNEFLIKRLKALSDVQIEIPESSIIEYKEALIFGFLGILKLRDEINCLASVTGAEKDHSSGRIFLPKINLK